MTYFEIVLIAIVLAIDAFVVSLAAGTNVKVRGARPLFRLSFHFGLFQFLMPIIGWLIGYEISIYTSAIDHWIVLILLSYIGIKMIISGLGEDKKTSSPDPSKGMTLLILSIATSVDAFAVGLSLALLNVSIWYPAVVIGIITASLSAIGVRSGNSLGIKFGKKMEIVGGIVLILLGVKIVLEHLVF
ncbi:MAG: manganese efflux pump MntP family protein [Ignavibacteria bacterium]|nr:manganese efflux pump MntP family protein [Ignavibacteria bacterium]